MWCPESVTYNALLSPLPSWDRPNGFKLLNVANVPTPSEYVVDGVVVENPEMRATLFSGSLVLSKWITAAA